MAPHQANCNATHHGFQRDAGKYGDHRGFCPDFENWAAFRFVKFVSFVRAGMHGDTKRQDYYTIF